MSKSRLYVVIKIVAMYVVEERWVVSISALGWCWSSWRSDEVAATAMRWDR